MKRTAVLLLAALLALAAGDARGSQTARLRVGLVVEPTGAHDPFGGIALAGLRRAVRQLGVEGRALTPRREGRTPAQLRLLR